MAFASYTLHLLISAPSDVDAGDLEVVQRTINQWNFRSGRRLLPTPATVIPLSWSDHAYSVFGVRPQESLNRQLVDEADLVVAMFADRLGTPTGDAESGTVEEINRMLAAGKHVSIFRSTAPRQLSGTLAVTEKLRLEEYIDGLKKTRSGLIFEYTEQVSLVSQVENMLSSEVERFVRRTAGAESADSSADPLIGVWPSVEVVETIEPDHLGQLRSGRRWYLKLDNSTGSLVRNVRHRFEQVDGTPDKRFDARHKNEVIELLGPEGSVRFPLSVNFQNAGQAICAVTWEDSQGEHETRATVRTL